MTADEVSEWATILFCLRVANMSLRSGRVRFRFSFRSTSLSNEVGKVPDGWSVRYGVRRRLRGIRKSFFAQMNAAVVADFADIGVWPPLSVVKVDDTGVGIEEGVNAGTWPVGLSVIGNAIGLSMAEWRALDAAKQDRQRGRLAARDRRHRSEAKAGHLALIKRRKPVNSGLLVARAKSAQNAAAR